MQPDLSHIDLPIIKVLEEIKEQLIGNNRLIVHAPPGAGKSTVVPLALLEECWLDNKKIIVLEPRRLAAKAIAIRMSELLGEKVGERVGYRIRFERKVSANTVIEVVTEGILIRMLQSDNELSDVGAVVFDEFHERSIFADVSLALAMESQAVLRPDLRLIVMSATLNVPELKTTFCAPLVESLGRQYPVEISYVDRYDVREIPTMMASTIKEVVQQKQGDILAFLPGEAEIRRCEEILRGYLRDEIVLPLYGMLPYSKQRLALMPHPNGRRKIVLATAIAETSLTIEGVRIVVDCGFERTSHFDLRTGLPGLKTTEITLDAADQRAGRAGRLTSGYCVRLWNTAKHHQLEKHRQPEILTADLTALFLDLAVWGCQDVNDLHWLTPPPKAAVILAKDTLTTLDALDELGNITEHGRCIHRLSCHPRIAHMLLMAEEHDIQHLACDVAALIEERDPIGKEAGVDINLRIDLLRRQRREKRLSRAMARIERVADSYRRILGVVENNDMVDPFDSGWLLALAFSERIACACPGNNAQFRLSNGTYAMIHHSDDLAYESWLSIAHLNSRENTGRIFLASPLNPKDLASVVKSYNHLAWDSKKGELIAEKQLRIGAIVLSSEVVRDVDLEDKVLIICNELKRSGDHLLNFDKTVQIWQNRVLSLRQWRENEEWPNVSTSHLLTTVDEWLSPYLTDVRNASDLKKLPLSEILKNSLDWQLQQKLDELAPERIIVPSGSKIRLEYRDNGLPPILSVRIQEVFGLEETPVVNAGKTKVLLHLLSPGFKPLQVTDDLPSFWNNAYFEIRKECMRRYPKHSWPDNPKEEPAVRGVKRKR